MQRQPSRRFWQFAAPVLVLLLWSATLPARAGKAAPPPPPATYSYTYKGDPSAVIAIPPTPAAEQSIMLMGGGYDVGEAFRWMIQRAGISQATPGHFLVLRATGTGAYDPYIYSNKGAVDPTTPMGYEMVGGIDLGLKSAATLIIPNRASADLQAVADIIQAAHAIFIAGGDQADYYNYWRGTRVETALRDALRRRIPIGGTSAGAEMLGQFAFVALNGTVTSKQALGDPFNTYMTIDPLAPLAIKESFLTPSALTNTITDVHVNTRDRLGRSIAFMARLGQTCGNGAVLDTSTFTIALDEETALLMEGTKKKLAVNPYNPANFTSSQYAAANSAYLVQANTSPAPCQKGSPLGYAPGGVLVTRLSDGSVPNPQNKTSYIAPVLESSAIYGVSKGAITFNGARAPY